MSTRPNIAKYITAILLASAACAGAADTYYVETNGNDVAHTGTNSWTNAFLTIGKAVSTAANGDSIFVSNGTYVLTAQVSVAKALDIRGFSGDPRDAIVNGNYPATTNRCFSVSHTSAVISALTITNGCVDAVGSGGGGGVKLTAGVVSNCVVSGNRSFTPYQWGVEGGGGLNIAITGTSGALVDSVISGNICTMYGGGVQFYVTSGPFVMRNCTISANTAITNSAGLYGGGGGFSGGASDSSYLLITNCSLVSNVSYSSGGGANFANGHLITNGLITHCVFRWNSVVAGSIYYGGGVYMSKGTLRNCLIADNSASSGRGGGVYCAAATTGDKMLQNCTVVSNVSSPSYGGGVHIVNSANPYFQNSIIWGNSGGASNVSVEAGSTAVSFTNCCTAGGALVAAALVNQYSTNNISVDPLFAGAASGNYRLSASSPCINAGVNVEWMQNAKDLDGFARLDRFYQRVDMGAYEFLPAGTMVSFR